MPFIIIVSLVILVKILIVTLENSTAPKEEAIKKLASQIYFAKSKAKSLETKQNLIEFVQKQEQTPVFRKFLDKILAEVRILQKNTNIHNYRNILNSSHWDIWDKAILFTLMSSK